MATPVVTVAAGGLPVVDVTATTPKRGLPVTEALNGYGTPVTKVAANGLPVTYSTDGGGGGGTSAEVAAWLARATTLDATHIAADTAFIDGLVADGLWPKFDVLKIYATQNTTTAVLNLVSPNYSSVIFGSPTFTVDRGFTGVALSPTIYIDTQFNGTSAVSPKYVQNSAHISLWSVVNVASSGTVAMGATRAGLETAIYPRYSDNNTYFRVNSLDTVAGFAGSTSAGHFVSNRSSSTSIQGYLNGSVVLTNNAVTSNTPPAGNLFAIGRNTNTGALGSPHQLAMISIGSSLSSTDATKFYNRLRTRMTAVGVP